MMPPSPTAAVTEESAVRVQPLSAQALNVPNVITISRLVLALVLFALIEIEGWWRTAAGVFIFAAATDFLDGYVARRTGQVTVLGRILDPFVDKIIICGSFLFLVGHPESGVCAWTAFVVFAREMFVTSLRAVLETHGVDFSAKLSGKLKMVAQCVAVPACLLSLSPEFLDALPVSAESYLVFRDLCVYAAVAATVLSGLIYCWRAAVLIGGLSEENGS